MIIPNRFAGLCAHCREAVKPRAGRVSPSTIGGWHVLHLACYEPWRTAQTRAHRQLRAHRYAVAKRRGHV